MEIGPSRGVLKAVVIGFGGLLAVILVLALATLVVGRSSHGPSCHPPEPRSKPLAVGASAPESFTGGGTLDVDGRWWVETDPATSPIAGGEHVDGTVTRTAPDAVVFQANGRSVAFRPTELACQ